MRELVIEGEPVGAYFAGNKGQYPAMHSECCLFRQRVDSDLRLVLWLQAVMHTIGVGVGRGPSTGQSLNVTAYLAPLTRSLHLFLS